MGNSCIHLIEKFPEICEISEYIKQEKQSEMTHLPYQMSSQQTKTNTIQLTEPAEEATSNHTDSDSESNGTGEFVWAPRPFYFCAKCLGTLNLPEPDGREGNYIVEKKVVEKVPQESDNKSNSSINTGESIVISRKRRQPQQQQQQQQKGKKKKTRLLLDDE